MSQVHSAYRCLQALAVFVANHLGGPYSDEAAFTDQYITATAPLKHNNRSVVIDIGTLRLGASRHRALLYKTLGDAMGLPSCIMKGLAHTGAEGVGLVCVQLRGAPYHLDMMEAPGTLTPLKQGLPVIPASESMNGTDIRISCCGVRVIGQLA